MQMQGVHASSMYSSSLTVVNHTCLCDALFGKTILVFQQAFLICEALAG